MKICYSGFVRFLNGSFYFDRRILGAALTFITVVCGSLASTQAQQPATPTAQSAAPIQTPPYPTVTPPPAQRTGLNIVVLDPSHGGTDPGARGAQGIRESDLVLDLTFQVRRALEAQGFQVLQTRNGNENPSFDDRSTLANGQRGAVFVTLHVSDRKSTRLNSSHG